MLAMALLSALMHTAFMLIYTGWGSALVSGAVLRKQNDKQGFNVISSFNTLLQSVS
ncbi:hypothetical protein KIN20_002344 [Parelaphostrongylus tenuis]|uniref:Uncharacterized protein n=1 Tax=Parelaphostrongylus tenuis TaxID=148309 RepID=A0AAD5MGG6_PARTN|nr:hypothetical protein KIN20_002344 [Parelaphostrongylus tenuis]